MTVIQLGRRPLLLGMGALMASTATAQDKPTDKQFGWPSVPPADAGFAPDLVERLDRLVASKRASNIHGVVILREGRLVLERYYKGADASRGRSLGQVAFGPDTLHDLRSVSKSIVGLLYGIALSRGKVPPPEANLLASFPQYADLAADPVRARWTIHNALTMTLGTEWEELAIPYTDPANSEIAMDAAPDRYRYVLGRPLVFHPGTRWTYCGGATALLGKLIADGTGKSLHDFAREVLFEPLGLGPSEWLKDAKGIEFAASGLRLRPRDLARIGQLVMEGGEARGRPIVAKEWLTLATSEFAVCDESRRYGYQWYSGYFAFTVPASPLWHRNRLERFWGCYGNGGQRLWVLPGIDLVVAVTAGNYDTPDQWVPPNRVMREVVLGSVL
ncbi:MAG: serine hydrolase domain-containing protein [Reyranellales bacterium]